MLDVVYDFYNLGTLTISINEREFKIAVDVCDHGARFTTKKLSVIETAFDFVERMQTVHFGEGQWLTLPNIEDAVLEMLDGSAEDVERLSQKYDDLLAASLPELITGNLVTGFVKAEVERLKHDSDI